LKTPATRQRGSILLEGLIAILIFSLGILSIVALLGASVKNTSNAKYRADASLLANEIIAQMWIGDKSNLSLKARYTQTSAAEFLAWQAAVARVLPATATNSLVIGITDDNVVTVTVRWQVPGESSANQYMAVTRING
jgi:type IV pilus assembly protein PilV